MPDEGVARMPLALLSSPFLLSPLGLLCEDV
jgi:hypothetical protein